MGRIRYINSKNDGYLDQFPNKEVEPDYLYVSIPEYPGEEFYVHSLVTTTYWDKPDPSFNESHHITNNVYDNRAINLLWTSRRLHNLIHQWDMNYNIVREKIKQELNYIDEDKLVNLLSCNYDDIYNINNYNITIGNVWIIHKREVQFTFEFKLSLSFNAKRYSSGEYGLEEPFIENIEGQGKFTFLNNKVKIVEDSLIVNEL
jgi:hypothetical protein